MLVVAVVGSKKTGKTTLIERLVADLSGMGCRIAVLKHIHHGDFEFDVEGKDTWRAFSSGAVSVAGISPGMAFIGMRGELPLADALGFMASRSSPDLVLLEGFSGMVGGLSPLPYLVLTGNRDAPGQVLARYGGPEDYGRVLDALRGLLGGRCRSGRS